MNSSFRLVLVLTALSQDICSSGHCWYCSCIFSCCDNIQLYFELHTVSNVRCFLFSLNLKTSNLKHFQPFLAFSNQSAGQLDHLLSLHQPQKIKLNKCSQVVQKRGLRARLRRLPPVPEAGAVRGSHSEACVCHSCAGGRQLRGQVNTQRHTCH